MYTGHQAAAAPVPQMPLPESNIVGAAYAKGMQQVAKNVDGMFLRGVAMEDAKNEFEAERELMSIDSDTQAEVTRMLNTPDGKEGSLFDKTGNIRQEKVLNLNDKVRQRLSAIGQNIIDPERRQRLMQRAALEGDKILDGLGKTWERETRKKMETAWKDAYDLALMKKDYDQVESLTDRGVELGLFSKDRGEVMKLKVAQTRMKEDAARSLEGYPVSVNIGGTEYQGLSASLAMDEARESGVQPDAASASTGDSQDMEKVAPVEQKQSATYDTRKVITMMPQGDFGDISDAFSYDYRVTTQPEESGRTKVSAAAYAPECVQRVAAYGNANGGIDATQARMMVSRISLDMVADNPDMTDEQALKVFDSAGIYEAMGDGDAAVGKVRCQAIVSECLSRGKGNADKLAMSSLAPLINAQLNSKDFTESREWGKMATLNPGLDAGDEWDKSDLEGEAREKWFALYDVYKKYRGEYKPEATGTVEKEEFEENAQSFHNWYMKNKYAALKSADMQAARDWYTMRAASELRDKAYTSVDGKMEYQGYGNDLQVARAVLREMPPARLGADELVAAGEAAQKKDAVRSEAFRKAAMADYEKLRGLKQSYKENSESAQKAKEREAKAEERKAEKEAREAEKMAEKQAARKLAVARATPRVAVWKWDGKNAPDGAYPTCLLPESENKRLVEELGYDGSQDVYLQMNGVRVQVVGISKSGKVELNSTAVSKIQQRPNRKKGETWKRSGELGFSYYFKTTEAK